ncbi:hypothetical protein [Paraburkholderia flava]|uniref:hypothetical protein n=1 Tax=Paraburkholderia flava TaxID=2547393 RepID=UPI001061E8E8|nr:hypothetical protein [Paraburkholderia flava]
MKEGNDENKGNGEGEKKPPDSLAVFSGISGALSPLSIRQRSEMPKEVKIKLGGHGVKSDR